MFSSTSKKTSSRCKKGVSVRHLDTEAASHIHRRLKEVVAVHLHVELILHVHQMYESGSGLTVLHVCGPEGSQKKAEHGG